MPSGDPGNGFSRALLKSKSTTKYRGEQDRSLVFAEAGPDPRNKLACSQKLPHKTWIAALLPYHLLNSRYRKQGRGRLRYVPALCRSSFTWRPGAKYPLRDSQMDLHTELCCRLGAHSRCYHCLDAIPPTEGGGIERLQFARHHAVPRSCPLPLFIYEKSR